MLAKLGGKQCCVAGCRYRERGIADKNRISSRERYVAASGMQRIVLEV